MGIKWVVDTTSSGIVFSKVFISSDINWTEVYDWCNAEFSANNWNFWYSLTTVDSSAITASFEFLREHEAIQFRLRW